MTEATVGRRQQPVDRDLRHRLPVSAAICVQHVDHVAMSSHRRPAGRIRRCPVQPAASGERWPRRMRPVSRPHPSGLHTSAPTPSAAPERHQIPLVVPADERVVHLVGDVARPAVPVGGVERPHQLPAGEVGHADVTDLAGGDEAVERGEHLLDRRRGVVGVQLEQVDAVRAQPAERIVDRR